MGAEPRLSGKRVVVTRPRERSLELCFLLEDEGAEVLALPLLEFLPPTDPRPLEAAASRLTLYRWIVFASPAAIPALVEAARLSGSSAVLQGASIAVVGPATERAARLSGLPVNLVSAVATGAGLFEALKSELQGGDEVLLPVAEEGRPELYEALRDAGVSVTRVVAYRSAKATVGDDDRAALRDQPADAYVFASPRTFDAFLEAFGDEARGLLAQGRAVAIGPTTARAMEGAGVAPATVAERPTAAELVEAVVRSLS